MQSQAFELFADYFQFYLRDEGVDPEAPTDWEDVDVQRRLKVVASIVVVVCPIRNMTVPVEVQVHDAEPTYDANRWSHIAECSIDLPTGKLQVHECTGGPVAHFAVAPGSYRVRAFYGALDTLRGNDLEGDDHYLVVLWPGTPTEPRVLKQYRDEAARRGRCCREPAPPPPHRRQAAVDSPAAGGLCRSRRRELPERLSRVPRANLRRTRPSRRRGDGSVRRLEPFWSGVRALRGEVIDGAPPRWRNLDLVITSAVLP